jgi:hypothetical protein
VRWGLWSVRAQDVAVSFVSPTAAAPPASLISSYSAR